MARPHRPRQVFCLPRTFLFKPVGIPARDLEQRVLKIDELEAMRLVDLEGLGHEEAALSLGVSRQTVGRLLEQGRRTVAEALLNGRALAIEGGVVQVAPAPACRACGRPREAPPTDLPGACPECGEAVATPATQSGRGWGWGRGQGRGHGCDGGHGQGRVRGGGGGRGRGRSGRDPGGSAL